MEQACSIALLGPGPKPKRTVNLVQEVQEAMDRARGLITVRGFERDFDVPLTTMRPLDNGIFRQLKSKLSGIKSSSKLFKVY